MLNGHPEMLAQSVPPWVLLHVPLAVFVFALGACVGSFINVVNYRLPAGESITRPPSRCPSCGERLKFFSDNLPILGWIRVRGRCRYCGVKISPQYMVVELMMALLFLGLYAAYFATPPSMAWWGEVGGRWWYTNQLIRAWPVFFAHAFLIAALLSMTIIDARNFVIPIQIPVFATVAAFIFYPLQAVLPHFTPGLMTWPIPVTSWQWTAVAALAMVGVGVGLILLRTKRLRYSFADYDDFLPPADGDEPEAANHLQPVTIVELTYLLPVLLALIVGAAATWWAGLLVGVVISLGVLIIDRTWLHRFQSDNEPKAEEVIAEYPHARREMLIELVFLAPCLIGAVAGYVIGGMLPTTAPPEIVQALGGSLLGYLSGGAMIWGTRVLGTFAFGREAMGLGDVHLLACVGAVLGWFDPILVFFIAPFSGILWAVLSMGLKTIFRAVRRELPYGPHLALATVVMILCRPGIHQLWTKYLPTVPWPAP
ncbi:MAG: prepilin peptidase [Planctomycetota bacterium]|jgi:prepilin signal peptidase PulO-like enzyme (type II secretory pathway)